MSTISTHLNWGASYVVNDVYAQQIKPDATEKELVAVGRITTVILMVISALIALSLTNALQLFNIILMFGAGTGLIFILRWFWWRINAWTEISAMLASGVISILIEFTSLGETLFGASGMLPAYAKFPFVVFSSTLIWLVVTYLTQPETKETLYAFYKKTQPGGPGWKKIILQADQEQVNIIKTTEKWSVPMGIVAMLLGCVLIYGALFTTGYFIYGQLTNALIGLSICVVSGGLLLTVWKKIKGKVL